MTENLLNFGCKTKLIEIKSFYDYSFSCLWLEWSRRGRHFDCCIYTSQFYHCRRRRSLRRKKSIQDFSRMCISVEFSNIIILLLKTCLFCIVLSIIIMISNSVWCSLRMIVYDCVNVYVGNKCSLSPRTMLQDPCFALILLINNHISSCFKLFLNRKVSQEYLCIANEGAIPQGECGPASGCGYQRLSWTRLVRGGLPASTESTRCHVPGFEHVPTFSNAITRKVTRLCEHKGALPLGECETATDCEYQRVPESRLVKEELPVLRVLAGYWTCSKLCELSIFDFVLLSQSVNSQKVLSIHSPSAREHTCSACEYSLLAPLAGSWRVH